MHRRFQLHRSEDVSKISGTGIVAEGCQFADGAVSWRWCVPGKTPTWGLAPNIDEFISNHGHDGKSKVVWIDQ